MKQPSRDDLALTANTIRGLAMDAVERAKSGHPGMPMGMADLAAVLFLKHLHDCPTAPAWINRDRFVLSAGHGSMLLYSLLHLSGYDLPMSELASFRQWDSKTPGHPEFRHTPGVETTTGPLGQGCANGVGMALAERMLAERFNAADFELINHYTYVIAGDGDLMEGISHEAFSLAGHLRLNKLIVFYDSNRITIEGSTDLAYSDDVKKRFQGYNWNVIEIDAHDFARIEKAMLKAKREKNRPSIVICRSHIAHGSPNKHDTASAHGEPLGEDEVKAAKRNIGLPETEQFHVPARVRELFESRLKRMTRLAAKWEKMRKDYALAHPEPARALENFLNQRLPDNLEASLPKFDVQKPIATRSASGQLIQEIVKQIPWLVGGAADLAPSTKTLIQACESVHGGAFTGRNLHFGIREHAMCGALNGMALHGGFRVFGATFFVFLDYCRPSVRLAALMKLPIIYIFTHDSFYVGEDGPTHQPVEHLASLRCMPNMTVIRPADATETAAAWMEALRNNSGPTAITLTRHNLPVIDRTKFPSAANLAKGAYTLWQSGDGIPEVLLIATGSEVHLALESAQLLAQERNIRVVSMPSWELFEKQDAAYKHDVIPTACATRLAIEAGSSMGWAKYVGDKGRALCVDRFGASAPYKTLAEKLGFTVQNVVSIVRDMKSGLCPQPAGGAETHP